MALCLRKIVVGVRQVILFEIQLSFLEIATFHVRDKHVEPKSFITGILGKMFPLSFKPIQNLPKVRSNYFFKYDNSLYLNLLC